jgi:hypothetical protein
MYRSASILVVLVCVACAGPSPTMGAGSLPSGLPEFSGPIPAQEVEALSDETAEESKVGWTVLMYIPNRLLDAFDMVRARLRLGPGFAAGARVTRAGEAYVGFYFTVYVGLPGPRGRQFPRLPVGLETRTGAALSVADATVEGGFGPTYGAWECGLGFQLALIGLDVGVDPYEILDFLVGFATYDLMDDDY